MRNWLRLIYTDDPHVIAAVKPILFEHRDFHLPGVFGTANGFLKVPSVSLSWRR